MPFHESGGSVHVPRPPRLPVSRCDPRTDGTRSRAHSRGHEVQRLRFLAKAHLDRMQFRPAIVGPTARVAPSRRSSGASSGGRRESRPASRWSARGQIHRPQAGSRGSRGRQPVEDMTLSVAFPSDAERNETHWSAPRADELVKTARAEVDDKKRTEMRREVQMLISRDGAGLIPRHVRDVAVVFDRIGTTGPAWRRPGDGRRALHHALVAQGLKSCGPARGHLQFADPEPYRDPPRSSPAVPRTGDELNTDRPPWPPTPSCNPSRSGT